MNVFIKDLAYYLPAKIVTNEELVQDFPEWSVAKIADKVGVNERRVAASNETATDLAILAAERLFSKGKLSSGETGSRRAEASASALIFSSGFFFFGGADCFPALPVLVYVITNKIYRITIKNC